MTIRVDGIGPRKRFWIIRNPQSCLGPFFSLEALACGLCHYCRDTDINLELFANCIRGEGPRYRFAVYHTGLAIGSHREKPCGKTTPPKPPPEEELSPDVQELLELLDALGPVPEPLTGKALLVELLGQFHWGCSRADHIMRESDCSGFSTRHIYARAPFCLRLDLSGDFCWANFSGAYIYSVPGLPQGNTLRAHCGMVNSYCAAKQTEVELSGLFVGASFQNARISYARLGGDFARADFRKARLNGCRLSGKFHGALLQDMDLSTCSIDPEARFAGADLRGACGLFYSEKQLVAARVRSADRVVVKTGRKIELLDREYDLCFPAQFLASVRIADATGESAGPSMKDIPVSLLEGDPTQNEFSDVSFLYDVVGMGLTRLEGGSAPVLKARGAVWDFRFNAPGVSLVNFNAVGHKVYLTGNFDKACLKDSQIGFLSLNQGSFKNFDLTDADVKRLDLRMAPTDLTGLRFPAKLRHVRLDCFREGTYFPIRVTTGTACEIIAVWNSPAECDALARGVLRRVKSLSAAMRQQLLCSSGCTPFSLLGGDLRPRGNLAIAVAILMRKNQMLLNSIRLAAMHGNQSTSSGPAARR